MKVKRLNGAPSDATRSTPMPSYRAGLRSLPSVETPAPTGAEGLRERVCARLKEIGVERGDGLVLGVSGGADSVALLRVLSGIAPDLGVGLRVLHAHHGLRPPPEADGDAAFVETLCYSLGVPCETVHLPVREVARARGQSLEDAARGLRRQALLTHRERHGMRAILLAHHLEDQAETVLLRLVRGSGAAGLGGMEVCTPDGIVRPFLPERRETLRTYLKSLSQPWREDATNGEDGPERNRVRHGVLPVLESLRPGAATRIALAARVLHEDAALLEELAGSWLVARNDPNVGPWMMVQAEAWRKAPASLRRQWIRLACRRLGLPMPSWPFADAWSTWPETVTARPDSPHLRLAWDAQGAHLFARFTPSAWPLAEWNGSEGARPVAAESLPAAAADRAPAARGPRLQMLPVGDCTRPPGPLHAHARAADAARWILRPAALGETVAGWEPSAPMRLAEIREILRRAGVPSPLRARVQVLAVRLTGAVLWLPGHSTLQSPSHPGAGPAAVPVRGADAGEVGMAAPCGAYPVEDARAAQLHPGRLESGAATASDVCLVWQPAAVSEAGGRRVSDDTWHEALQSLLRP